MARTRQRRDGEFQSEDWRGLVVICSGTSWDGPHLSDRHLAERLCGYAPVLFVDLPVSFLTPMRRADYRGALEGPRLRLVREGLARLSPIVTPGMSRPGLRALAMWATRQSMGRAVRRLGGDVEAVVIGSLDDLFGACGERQRMLWGTDDFVAAGALTGVATSWLSRRETAQLAEADVISTVSEELASRWRTLSGKDVVVIPNGCDTALFGGSAQAPCPTDVCLPGPIALFVGHLSDRIDVACLEAVADTGVSLLLVGQRQRTFKLQRLDRLFARPNVQWVGPKPFRELGSYLRVSTVGLTPYANSDFNRSSFPLKTLEYLAAGRRVVSTDLPATRRLGTDLVTIASTPREFADAAARIAHETMTESETQRAKAYAAQHDWDARIAEIAGLLGLVRG